MTKFRKILWITAVVAVMSISMGLAGIQTPSTGAGGLSDSDAMNTANLWASLVSKADIAGLESLLNEKYVHIHATALVESKAQFIEALKTGDRKYDPIKIEDVSSRIFDGFAIVTGKFNLKAVSRGKAVEGINRFSMVVVKTTVGFQVVSFQATGIRQP